ncbi:MAG: carbohydrate ABC transporter permease [Chloroflexi bacterium]|nr:carbohydrate ABC transporter permease [Chloroflexota bacterium]
MVSYSLRSLRPGQATISYAVLAPGGVTMVIPFLYTLSSSLKVATKVYSYPPELLPDPVRLENYVDVLRHLPPYTFVNSAIAGITIVVGSLALGLMAGFALARLRFPAREAIFVVLVSSLFIPGHVTIVPLFVFVNQLGWTNSLHGLVLPALGHVSVAVFWFRQFFRTVPAELYEAARIDGASPGQALLDIYLPEARPAIGAYAVITFLGGWNMYLWPLLILRKEGTETVTLKLAMIQASNTEPSLAMAGAVLSVLPILVVFIVAQRQLIQGVSRSGLVG